MRVKQITYHDNGSVLAIGYLKDGKSDGYWKWYREDGTKMKTGYFKDGELAKEWMYYDENGTLIKKKTNCFICKAEVPDIEGPVSKQAYLPQSPGCWKIYTEVLAKEYGEWKYPDIHRLTVDCYAAQHPTLTADVKSAQSVTVHLIGIYLALHTKLTSREITNRMGTIVDSHKGTFRWLSPPKSLGEVTIAEVYKAQNLDEHVHLVRSWAAAVWDAWTDYHEGILHLEKSL